MILNSQCSINCDLLLYDGQLETEWLDNTQLISTVNFGIILKFPQLACAY